jgi:hypothetical protein
VSPGFGVDTRQRLRARWSTTAHHLRFDADLDAADAQRFPLQLISDAARESNDKKYFSSHHYSVVSQTRMLTNKCYMPLSEFVFYAH